MQVLIKIRALLKRKVVSNAIHLLTLQVINNLLPLITIPYLVHVLGTKGFGVMAFSQLVGGYLIVISDYGFNLSVTRLISLNRNDSKKCAEIFNQVITLKIVILILLCLLLLPVIFFVDNLYAYKEIYFFTYFLALGQVLFPVWYFQGMQKMNYILWPNALSKITSTALIFLFVATNNDLELAVFFNVIGSLIAGVLGVYFAFKSGAFVYKRPALKALLVHVKEGFDVFIPTFFSSVINNGGAFILGVFHGPLLVGYYSAIDKIVRALLNLFYPISQALFPGIAQQLSENKTLAMKKIAKVGFLISVIILFGIGLSLLVSDKLIGLLYGIEYKQYTFVLHILLFWLLFGVINNFIGVQFLVGSGNSKYYRKSFLIAGGVITLLYLSIKFYAINGVVFSMLAGEILLMILMIYFIVKQRLYLDDK